MRYSPERWQEIHRLFRTRHVSITEIARHLDLDRKTVRRCLRQGTWQPYTRPPRPDTLLGEHANYLRHRSPQVRYSVQILFQELRYQRGYRGSYETVRVFVQHTARRTAWRLERLKSATLTPPGTFHPDA